MTTTSSTLRSRLGPSAIFAAVVALMAAGPGTLLIPAATRLTQPIVCESGARIEHQRVRYSYHGPGESSIEVNCVTAAGGSEPVLEKAMLTLFGLYFVVLFPIALLKTPMPSPAAERTAYRAARRRERAAALPPGAESGESVTALRELKEMADAGLITAQEFERKKGEILSRL